MKTGRKAWFGQRSSDIETKGAKLSPWIVFWNCPDIGKRREKSCGAGKKGWRLARNEADRIHSAIVSGTYSEPKGRKADTWEAFWADYERDALPRLSAHAQCVTRQSVGHFVRIIEPTTLKGITSKTVDQFTAKRRAEKIARTEQTVSPATVNKELRHLRVVLRKASKWGLLAKVPAFEFELEQEHDPIYCTADDFALIYAACDAAKNPKGRTYSPGDWWRALLVTLYMTGWRIGETIALKRADVDLESGVAKLRAETTKGKRDATIRLHPVVIEHLQALRGLSEKLFSWPLDRQRLYTDLGRIQDAAGLEDRPYSFHDLRRAFATMNAANLSAPALQAMMRHRDYQTTQRYINMAKQLDSTPVEVLHVPAILKRTGAATT